MSKFITGNVVKLKNGSIVIVAGINTDFNNKEVVRWISFDYANVSGSTNTKSYNKIRECFCGNDEDCENCKGSGKYTEVIEGFDDAVFLGSNVKDYIIKSLTKNFNF